VTDRKRQILGDSATGSGAMQSLSFMWFNEIASASASWGTPRNNSQISDQWAFFVRASIRSFCKNQPQKKTLSCYQPVGGRHDSL